MIAPRWDLVALEVGGEVGEGVLEDDVAGGRLEEDALGLEDGAGGVEGAAVAIAPTPESATVKAGCAKEVRQGDERVNFGDLRRACLLLQTLPNGMIRMQLGLGG